MSYLIDNQENILFSYSNHNNTAQSQGSLDYGECGSCQYKIEKTDYFKILGRLSDSLINATIDEKSIVYRILLTNIIRMVLRITINLRTQQILISFKLLSTDNKYMVIDGKNRRLMLFKSLNSRLCQGLFAHFRVSISSRNNQVVIQCPMYLVYSPYKQSASIVAIIRKMTEEIINLYDPLVSLMQCSNFPPIQYIRNVFVKNSKGRVENLYGSAKFMNTQIYFTQETSMGQQKSINQKYNRQIESIQALKRTYVTIGQQFSHQSLYLSADFLSSIDESVLKFQIQSPRRQEMAKKIQTPTMHFIRKPNQNLFVLNYILPKKKISESRLTQIDSGGYSIIYAGQVQYWYVSSSMQQINLDQLPDTVKTQPLIKKNLALKHQVKNGVNPGRIRKVDHQRLILTKIKSGVSMFLPKYYILAEKDNGYEKDLLLDYVEFPNLKVFMNNNKQILTCQTKLYLGYTIAQGLKYLHEYRIFHLDLKPTNIMMYKKMMIKLIDFGQSYHPDIQSNFNIIKDHKPGFTVPYSAPQNYKLPQNYNQKNDIFSLGVILYELLFQKYPFYPSEYKKDYCYLKSTISNYWFFVPEQNIQYGELTIFPMINLLIGKCLSPDPEKRPELEWIILILRECLDYFF